jgi:hypothetical protein
MFTHLLSRKFQKGFTRRGAAGVVVAWPSLQEVGAGRTVPKKTKENRANVKLSNGHRIVQGAQSPISRRRKDRRMNISGFLRSAVLAILFSTLGLGASAAFAQTHTSSQFQGPKVNKGTVTHSIKDGKSVLTLSDDFVVPDTPDPIGRWWILTAMPICSTG